MKNENFNEKLQELKEFCKSYQRLPNKRKNNEEERILYYFLNRNRTTSEIKELTNLYSRKRSFEEVIKRLEDFCEIYQRLPDVRKENAEEKRLCIFLYSHKDDPRIVKLRETYRKNNTFSENLEELRNFCGRYHRLPTTGKGRSELRLRSFLERYRKVNPEIEELYKTYKVLKGFDETLKSLIEFCKTNNRLPKRNREVWDEESRLKSFMERYKDKSEIDEIKKKYS